MRVYAVVVNRDDTVRVESAEVLKTTPQFYVIENLGGLPWDDPRRAAYAAFRYSSRVRRDEAHTSERAALERYMARRQRDKASALSVVGQATKQIASANELLMHVPVEEPESVGAVDPVDGIATDCPRA